MGTLVHTCLGSSYLIAHVLHCLPPLPAHSSIIGPAVICIHTPEQSARRRLRQAKAQLAVDAEEGAVEAELAAAAEAGEAELAASEAFLGVEKAAASRLPRSPTPLKDPTPAMPRMRR